MKEPRSALRSFLARKGMTKDAFAKKVGVSRPAISVLLSDERREPSLALAIAIERVTGGSVPARSWLQSTIRHAS
jgi:DNA-binding XRE family transcriptional regulator